MRWLFMFEHMSEDEARELNLSDAVKKAGPNRQQFRRLIQAIVTSLGLESAEDMSDAELLDIFEGLTDVARTYHQVLDRMKKLIDQDEAKLPRIQQGEAFARQLVTST